MSLVTTAMLSSVPSSRQSSAIRELLPVPTGPATPIRRALLVLLVLVSGTEQPPLARPVTLPPPPDGGGAVGSDVGGGPGLPHRGHGGLDRRCGVGCPTDAEAGVEGFQLERGGHDGLDVLVRHEPRRLLR